MFDSFWLLMFAAGSFVYHSRTYFTAINCTSTTKDQGCTKDEVNRAYVSIKISLLPRGDLSDEVERGF
jgi:hypothetical protein